MTTLMRDPIYQQLNTALRGLVREFAAGQKFLSEREVSERFGVSRATANKALSNLVVEGVVQFRKGIGTFVRGDVLDYDLRDLVSFTHKAAAAGKKPSTQVLTFAPLPPGGDADARAALDVGPDERLIYVERLRFADGVAVILERRHMLARFCGGLTKADLRGSLYEFWSDRLGLDIAGADETITAVNIRGADAKLLGVPGGSAGLLIVATGQLSGGERLWYERTLYRGGTYKFHNRLGRIQSARPAVGTLTGGKESDR